MTAINNHQEAFGLNLP